MFSTQRRLAATLIALLAVLAGACGNGAKSAAPTDTIATLADSDASTTPETDDEPAATSSETNGLEAPENPEDAYALFDACLEDAGLGGSFVTGGAGDTENGVIAVDEFSEAEIIEIDPQSQGLEDFDFEEFDQAMGECEGHLANIDGSFDLSPEEQAAFEDAQLEWADCMAKQGIDVPEVDSNGGFAIGIEVEVGGDEIDPQGSNVDLSAADFDFEAFDEAAQACDQVFEEFDAQFESAQ